MTLDDFLRAIIADPLNATETWLVLADWLEDQGDSRFELVRLLHQPEYCGDLAPEQRDTRVRDLLASGMQPVVPAIENSLGMRFVLIPAGSFLMGSPEGEGRSGEHPPHQVEITRPVYMGAFQVTQEEYQRVMGNNPSYFCASGGTEKVRSLDTRRFPVEFVSWEDAVAFCKRLSNLPGEKNIGRVYRLPTEAEWEYSCRGGATSHSPFHFGDSLASTEANFDGNYPSGKGKEGPYLERTCPVGCYPANAFGLYDMHGNVWEWCSDWHDEKDSKNSPKRDSQDSAAQRHRLRGGSWINYAIGCRANNRAMGPRGPHYGFRICFLLDF